MIGKLFNVRSERLLTTGMNFDVANGSQSGEMKRIPTAPVRYRLAAVCVVLAAVSGIAGAAGLEGAREELRAALETRSRAAAEFETMTGRGKLSAADIEDYRAFLDRLEGVVVLRCREVLRLRAAAADHGPEPGCPAAAAAAPPVLSFPDEQTEAERIRTLDRRLGGSLSEFDEMLLREMEEVAAARSGSPDGGGAGAGGDASTGGGAGEAGEGEPGGKAADAADAEATAGTRQGAGRRQDQDPEKPPEMTQVEPQEQGDKQRRTAAVKRDSVPGAADDDIVARQLREAAESETDPELRAKLWEEYRRYKGEQAQRQ
jgi:hypothetical protein